MATTAVMAKRRAWPGSCYARPSPWCSQMTPDSDVTAEPDWRTELPTLVLRQVTLRELGPSDLGPLVDLLSTMDATRFGPEEPDPEVAAQQLIERAAQVRSAGAGFTYAITIGARRAFVGL